jgi:hypothetical protein
MPMKPQGWYHDPYGVHEERYFSDGQPTKLVCDCGIESYDPPPSGPPGVLPDEMTPSKAPYGDGDRTENAASYDREAAYNAVQEVLARNPIM